jgi:hypothetical protein
MGRMLASLVLVALSPAVAHAEWQLKPFIGFTFGGSTTFVDPQEASGEINLSLGVSGVWLGEVFGLEGDLGVGPGFFEHGENPSVEVREDGVTTLTGNLVIAMPRRMAGYGLRPYVVVGGGLMYVNALVNFGVVKIASTLPALDFGGGATGFFNERLGVSWELRRFRSLGGGDPDPGTTVETDAKLSFWRLNMALAIRY